MNPESRHVRTPSVSLVATVLNEYGSIPAWLDGLRCQTRYPDELVVVDGGSNDGTLELLSAAELPFRFRIIELDRANIAQGRNRAIDASEGDIVVVTDAGTVAGPRWLERIVRPLESDVNVDVSAGFFNATGESMWFQSLASTTLPGAHEIDGGKFLPSSRSVAFRRAWFRRGFRYPEWLDFCEDVVFDLRLRRAGVRQVFVPSARVGFRPRSGPVSFFRQYYRYARGDGKAGLFAGRHAVRYLSYAMGATILSRRKPAELGILIVMGSAYMRRASTRYRMKSNGTTMSRSEFATAHLLMGAQRLIGDVAKMTGYPVGLIWRVRHDREWRLWKTTWMNRTATGDLRRF